MRGPLGGRKVKLVAPEPKSPQKRTSRILEPLRGSCHHPWRWHGDRVTGACHAGFDGGATTTRTGPATPLCPCRGWERDEMRRTA